MLNQLLASLPNTKMECIMYKIAIKPFHKKTWGVPKTVIFPDLQEMCTQLTE